ncbi:hypothetical protein V6N13_106489 [Hibiscus sabdariffa]
MVTSPTAKWYPDSVFVPTENNDSSPSQSISTTEAVDPVTQELAATGPSHGVEAMKPVQHGSNTIGLQHGAEAMEFVNQDDEAVESVHHEVEHNSVSPHVMLAQEEGYEGASDADWGSYPDDRR